MKDRNYYVLLRGLPGVDAEVSLADGVTLRPLAEPITVFDLAAAGARGFREWAVLEPYAHLCTCEIETAADARDPAGYDTLHRAWLASAILCLVGFTRHLAVASSTYSWNLIAGHQRRSFQESKASAGVRSVELPSFEGNLLDFHVRSLRVSFDRSNALGSDDLAWIRQRFQALDRMCVNSLVFRFALEAAVDWRFAGSERNAIARLWGGIEALFKIDSELSYRIAAYSASLLEPRGQARKERFSAVKKLYNLRSKAVHGANLTTTQLQLAIDQSFELLRDLVNYCLEKESVPTPEDLDGALFT